MAYLLRALILIMLLALCLTSMVALGWIDVGLGGHIPLAIVSFIYTMFAQAFVMFYFIGVSRLTKNVQELLRSQKDLQQLFDEPPADLGPYLKKVDKFVYDSDLFKRKTIPWTMLMLVLGSLAFLLGGAHDTALVSRPVHAGVAYGFLVSMLIGLVRQWIYLGQAHLHLRKLKGLFSLPDAMM